MFDKQTHERKKKLHYLCKTTADVHTVSKQVSLITRVFSCVLLTGLLSKRKLMALIWQTFSLTTSGSRGSSLRSRQQDGGTNRASLRVRLNHSLNL